MKKGSHCLYSWVWSSCILFLISIWCCLNAWKTLFWIGSMQCVSYLLLSKFKITSLHDCLWVFIYFVIIYILTLQVGKINLWLVDEVKISYSLAGSMKDCLNQSWWSCKLNFIYLHDMRHCAIVFMQIDFVLTCFPCLCQVYVCCYRHFPIIFFYIVIVYRKRRDEWKSYFNLIMLKPLCIKHNCKFSIMEQEQYVLSWVRINWLLLCNNSIFFPLI